MSQIKIEKNIPIPKHQKIFLKIFGYKYPFDKLSKIGDSFFVPLNEKYKTNIENYFYAKISMKFFFPALFKIVS